MAKSKHLKIVLNGTLSCDGSLSPCFEYKEDGTAQVREELNLLLEEADTHVTPHNCYKALNGYKRIVFI